MFYFNGFSLIGEEILFQEILDESDFSVVGFSYGAIKALNYTLDSKKRVDRLILISPAFFQNRDKKFKRLQLLSFQKDRESYISNFLKSCSKFDLSQFVQIGTYEELKELLEYEWSFEQLDILIQRGVKIFLYLGENDLIVDSKSSLEFFKKIVTKVYFINGVGHDLR